GIFRQAGQRHIGGRDRQTLQSVNGEKIVCTCSDKRLGGQKQHRGHSSPSGRVRGHGRKNSASVGYEVCM
ncbi:hypothetical protein GGI22_006462, partial [Coemansia erecta]